MDEPEEFKKHLAGIFSRASIAYDRTGPNHFSHFGRKLVEVAGIISGARVLDVACGRGAVFFPAAMAIGVSGEVVGIDISEGMIQEINKDIAQRGVSNGRALKMDAECLDFSDSSFDAVLCGLALFFLPDLDKALQGFHRVLKPGGRFAASTFQQVKDEEDPRWDALYASVKDSLKPIPTAARKWLDNEEEIRQVLTQAGFSEIEVIADQETFYLKDEEEWWRVLWSQGDRAFLERMETDVLARYKKQAMELKRAEKSERGIPNTWNILYSRAKKPT